MKKEKLTKGLETICISSPPFPSSSPTIATLSMLVTTVAVPRCLVVGGGRDEEWAKQTRGWKENQRNHVICLGRAWITCEKKKSQVIQACPKQITWLRWFSFHFLVCFAHSSSLPPPTTKHPGTTIVITNMFKATIVGYEDGNGGLETQVVSSP